jgi:hypothetical protein
VRDSVRTRRWQEAGSARAGRRLRSLLITLILIIIMTMNAASQIIVVVVVTVGRGGFGLEAYFHRQWSDICRMDHKYRSYTAVPIILPRIHPHLQPFVFINLGAMATQQSPPQLQHLRPRGPDIQFRVLIIGRANAGKTSILQKVCDTTDSPEIYKSRSSGTCELVRSRVEWRFRSHLLARFLYSTSQQRWACLFLLMTANVTTLLAAWRTQHRR